MYSSDWALGPGGDRFGESDSLRVAEWVSLAEEEVGVEGMAVSNDWTKGVGIPRTGSPRAEERSCSRTCWREMLAALRARACARAYGSRCRLFCWTVEAWSTGVEAKVRQMCVEGDAVEPFPAVDDWHLQLMISRRVTNHTELSGSTIEERVAAWSYVFWTDYTSDCSRNLETPSEPISRLGALQARYKSLKVTLASIQPAKSRT